MGVARRTTRVELRGSLLGVMIYIVRGRCVAKSVVVCINPLWEGVPFSPPLSGYIGAQFKVNTLSNPELCGLRYTMGMATATRDRPQGDSMTIRGCVPQRPYDSIFQVSRPQSQELLPIVEVIRTQGLVWRVLARGETTESLHGQAPSVLPNGGLS